MKRLQTFLTYILIIIAFFIVSNILENELIEQMYYKMDGDVNSSLSINGSDIDVEINIKEAKSTNVNGYIIAEVTNHSEATIDEAYVKVMLYSKSGVYATQKYLEIDNLQPGETKEYKLKFQGAYIKSYAVTAEEDFPDKDSIFNFFGYEINLKNVFGFDLSKYISSRSIGEFVKTAFTSVSVAAKSVPMWAYVWASLIILGVL